MKQILGATSLAFALSLALAPQAHAADKDREVSSNAPANCQSNLPTSDVSIRKRPLAMQNEGTSNVVVTCAFVNEYDVDDIRAISYFGVFLSNRGTAAATVTCTGVAGYEGDDPDLFVSKQVVVPANNSAQAPMFFTVSDNGGNGYYPLVGMSCSLPGGVGINDTYVGYASDDAGA